MTNWLERSWFGRERENEHVPWPLARHAAPVARTARQELNVNKPSSRSIYGDIAILEDRATSIMTRNFSVACERNREPILAVLRDRLAQCKSVLEIGSGTGQHAVFFAAHLPHLVWQTSDFPDNHASIDAWRQETQLPNVLAPLTLDVSGAWPEARFDAVYSANTCHIMSWHDVERMFDGIGRTLQAGGMLCIYGPFNYGGAPTSMSNAQFDAMLRAQAAHMGIRDFEAVNRLAADQGLVLQDDIAMPANNRLLVWQAET